MEGAAVATTTTAGGAAVVAGLSYAGGAVGTAVAGTGMVATAAAATTELGSGRSGFPLRASGLDHPGPLRDRGGRCRRLVVHRQHSQAQPRRDLPLHQVRAAVGRRHRRLVHQRSGGRGQQQGDAVCGRRDLPADRRLEGLPRLPGPDSSHSPALLGPVGSISARF